MIKLKTQLSIVILTTQMLNFTATQNKEPQDFDSLLKAYRALHHRHETVTELINDLKSGTSYGKTILSGVIGGIIGAGSAAKISDEDAQATALAGIAGCGIGIFGYWIKCAIFRYGKNISEYEKERNALEKSFLKQECAIIKHASRLDSQYINQKLTNETNQKLKEIFRDLTQR